MEEIIANLKVSARKSWPGQIGDERASNLESFVRKMSAEYAEALGLPQEDVLRSIEGRRRYCCVNYYQAANFPSLSKVRIFGTQADLVSAMPSLKFRCPMCNGVSTNPYACNTGLEMEPGKVCDWKAGGLFGTMGKGIRIMVRDGFLQNPAIEEIFMPLELEEKGTCP